MAVVPGCSQDVGIEKGKSQSGGTDASKSRTQWLCVRVWCKRNIIGSFSVKWEYFYFILSYTAVAKKTHCLLWFIH